MAALRAASRGFVTCLISALEGADELSVCPKSRNGAQERDGCILHSCNSVWDFWVIGFLLKRWDEMTSEQVRSRFAPIHGSSSEHSGSRAVVARGIYFVLFSVGREPCRLSGNCSAS